MVPALSSPTTAARGESDLTPASIPPAPKVSYMPQPWEQEREWQVAQSIEVNMDLIAAAKQHLHMLRDVDKWQCLYGGPALKRAIDRYELCWLPLAHAIQTGAVVMEGTRPPAPPLDVQWVWHCHRLGPIAYGQDCYSLYGTVIECPSATLSEKALGHSRAATCRLWERTYPHEPYLLDLTLYEPNPWGRDLIREGIVEGDAEGEEKEREVAGVSRAGSQVAAPQRCKSDLAGRVKRQQDFYYHVSEPHYQSDAFLKLALERYRAFLHVMNLSKGAFFCVPTYDVDLMWHTHQWCPTPYANSTIPVFGKIQNHEEESDRTDGKRLEIGFRATCWLWDRLFGKSFIRAGVLYRGDIPTLVPGPPQMLPPVNDDGPPGGGVLGGKVAAPGGVQREDVNQLLGLKPRRISQVCVNIMSARSLPSRHCHLVVHGRSLAKCQRLDLRTAKQLHHPPHPVAEKKRLKWGRNGGAVSRGKGGIKKGEGVEEAGKGDEGLRFRQLWNLEVEEGSTGLEFELLESSDCDKDLAERGVAEGGGGVVLGRAKLEWAEMAKRPKEMGILRWMELIPAPGSNTGPDTVPDAETGPPELLADASLTPGVVGPYLLWAIREGGGDTWKVVDHTGAARWRIHCRWEACGRGCQCGSFCVKCAERPIHGGFRHEEAGQSLEIRKFVRDVTPQHDVTPHDHDDIISQVFQIHPPFVPSSSPIVEPNQTTWAPRDRSWSLTVHLQDPALSFDEKTRKEKKEGSIGGTSHVLKGLDFRFPQNDGQDPSRLLIGRWLKYETKQGAKARSTEGGEVAKDEFDYVTLVRYSASFPRGCATALMNWRLGAIEVDPLESSVLVMSISRAISLSVEAVCRDSGEGVGGEREIPLALNFLEEGDEWDSVVVPSNQSRCGGGRGNQPLKWWLGLE